MSPLVASSSTAHGDPAARPRRTLVVLQPGYLPWLGFFEQMRQADVFVYYDDVQYDKHGWRNRNRIKTQAGVAWLTVPVRHTGLGPQRIMDVEIDNRSEWARKHVATLRQAYARAPYVARFVGPLEELLLRRWERLVDLDIATADMMREWLGVTTAVERASGLDVGGDRTERLLNLCRRFGATRYYSGAAARDYLDVARFRAEGIDVEWQGFGHPVYRQEHGAFVPYLSAVDLVLNCGDEAKGILADCSRATAVDMTWEQGA